MFIIQQMSPIYPAHVEISSRGKLHLDSFKSTQNFGIKFLSPKTPHEMTNVRTQPKFKAFGPHLIKLNYPIALNY